MVDGQKNAFGKAGGFERAVDWNRQRLFSRPALAKEFDRLRFRPLLRIGQAESGVNRSLHLRGRTPGLSREAGRAGSGSEDLHIRGMFSGVNVAVIMAAR